METTTNTPTLKIGTFADIPEKDATTHSYVSVKYIVPEASRKRWEAFATATYADALKFLIELGDDPGTCKMPSEVHASLDERSGEVRYMARLLKV